MTQAAPDQVAATMLGWHDLDLVSCRRIQTLWAGYGCICEVRARRRRRQQQPEQTTDTVPPLILKLITPPVSSKTEDEGHLRKMLSYEVEQYFYEVVAPRLSSSLSSQGPAIARCLATSRDQKAGQGLPAGIIATLITDLRPEFSVPGEKRAELGERQVYAALDWLAGFHGVSRAWVGEDLLEGKGEALVRPPLEEADRRKRSGDDEGKKSTTVWLNGGYTYLATRRQEYAALAADVGAEWSGVLCRPYGDGDSGSSVSERVAEFLAPRPGGGVCRPYESYIHGDVKSENLFATARGERVAFFDFQYVGVGLGVCDLAKLFTCSVPLGLLTKEKEDAVQLEMQEGERTLLEHYHRKLRESSSGESFEYEWDLLVRHWEAALVDWLRFQMSWGAWGNTEWLEARVRAIVRDDGFKTWLLENSR